MSRPSDIIVVGAGIVGCSVAYELARRGASVDIVDERGVALGATQASAGMLVPYHEAGGDSPLLPLATASLDLYDDFIEAVSADSGVRIPYHRTGSLEVAMNDAEFAALRACADALRERGVPSMLLDRAGARTEEPHLAADVVGALLVEPHGFVAAADFTRALAIAARARGRHMDQQDRYRRSDGSRSGSAGSWPAAASGMERNATAAHHMEPQLLSRAVGRWDAARRRH